MKQILLTWALCLTATLGFAQVVDVPEKMAEYPGGTGELMNFLSRSLKYPVECEKSGIEGRVILSFVVNEDGTISNVEGMKSPDERLTAEAKRVVGLMPKWSPAVNKGKAVKMRYTLPFTFRLPDKKRQVLDKGACEELSRLIAGKRENPRGLYRLMGFSYENGTADKEAHIEQYKYCTDGTTLQLQIHKDVEGDKPEFWMTMLNQDRRALNYTGRIADKDISIFDSSSKGFKLRWHNNIMNNEYFPGGQYITELYSADYKISPKIQRVIDLLKMHTAPAGTTNKFYGCWYRVGILTKVDGMDMLLPGHQPLYQIFDRDVYLNFYELQASRMFAYCIMRPIAYKSDSLLIQYGSENKITWVDDNTFRLSFDRGDGTIVTELWKRSGLPERYQQVFGTDIPVYKGAENPLPNYFGGTTAVNPLPGNSGGTRVR